MPLSPVRLYRMARITPSRTSTIRNKGGPDQARSLFGRFSPHFVILSGAQLKCYDLMTDGREVEGSRGYFCNHGASGSSLEGLSPEAHFAPPMFGEVLPARIGFFDQRNFLFAPPAFELLFPADRVQNVAEGLIVDQAMDFIFFGKAFNGIHLVLRDATINVASDANIERACPAGEDVNPERVVVAFAHGRRVSQQYRENSLMPQDCKRFSGSFGLRAHSRARRSG